MDARPGLAPQVTVHHASLGDEAPIRVMRRILAAKSLVMLGLIVTGSVLLAAFAARLAPLEVEPSSTARSQNLDGSDIKDYMGNEACLACHAAEFASAAGPPPPPPPPPPPRRVDRS